MKHDATAVMSAGARTQARQGKRKGQTLRRHAQFP
jgi:hypothetical protein